MSSIETHMENNTQVYSLEHGPGEVVNIFKLYDGLEDYFEVRFFREGITKHFPVRGYTQIRFSSVLCALKDSLVELGKKINNQNFKFSRSSYYAKSVRLDILYVTSVIASLTKKALLTDDDKMVLGQCLNSLILEVANVFKVNEATAKGIVSDHMRSV